jgi:hypothetical protein
MHTSGDSSASITAPLVLTRIALGVGSDGGGRGACIASLDVTLLQSEQSKETGMSSQLYHRNYVT